MSYRSSYFEATIIALCLLSGVVSLVEQRVLHLLPSDSSQEACPVELCFTLNNVIENKEFISNTKFILYPGVYMLSDNFSMIFISNVSNLAITKLVGQLEICHICNAKVIQASSFKM